MAMFSLRLEDGLAARFDAAARVHGGRSARLRQLVRADAAGPAAEVEAAVATGCAARLMVRLRPAEAAFVGAEARAMGLRPATWVASLVAWRAGEGVRFSAAGEQALIAAHGEIHRIGVNVNQIARALNTAVMEGRVLDLEMADLERLRAELAGHVDAVRRAAVGQPEYWSGRS